MVVGYARNNHVLLVSNDKDSDGYLEGEKEKKRRASHDLISPG
jgi:hypothetical protein